IRGNTCCCLSKPLLIMKLTLLLLTVTFMQVSAATYAQKVTLKAQQATLKEIFGQIQAQTSYDFLYNSEDLKLARPVTVNVNNATLTEVLLICFKNQPLSYAIDNTTIIITKKPLANFQNAPPKKVITGKVTDSKGVTLPGVTVREKGGTAATVTDGNGHYKITVSNESATLVFTFIGFTTKEMLINGKENIDIALE